MKKGSKKDNSLVCNIGFNSGGVYKVSNNGIHTKVYKVWKAMIERCFSTNFQQSNPSYIKCNVSQEWLDFQVFADWFEQNYIEGFAMDKDILIKDNKEYSSKTCCFVPKEVNSAIVKCDKSRGNLPIGVYNTGGRFNSKISRCGKRTSLGIFNTAEEAFEAYKVAKEAYMKELAEKHKHQITEACYQALINYKIEITD